MVSSLQQSNELRFLPLVCELLQLDEPLQLPPYVAPLLLDDVLVRQLLSCFSILCVHFFLSLFRFFAL
ncbi:hypothetical protein JCM19239_4603 [Vibrio variabilis]|uniref:Uncharacterized protein n=1 Tax=Vibrio variabilis TaxID=990271 RepID=A0ABQ0J7Y6_9VIBR|nr:hypothetical protein JCM19239_4603 [Vibrio variabilis]